MPAESELPELISSINELAMGLAQDRVKKQAKEKAETGLGGKKLANSLAKNSAAILGLSQGLTSLKGFFSQAVKDNTQIVKQLSQFTTASKTTTRHLTDSITTGYTTMQEGLATQGELIRAGMGDMGKGSKETFIAMKALGVNLAGVISITRFNQEALGISTEASTDLAQSLIETAMANSSSMEDLVSAVQSMRAALIKTTVELGPEMSLKVQNVVARMTQNNSDLAAAAASFVTSLVSGEEGFFKAARLGVMFTGRETEEQLVAKIEELSNKMGQMSAGARGGVQFQRFEDAFGITRENFMVAKEMGTDIKGLKRASVKSAADQMKQLDSSRQMEIAAMRLQAKGVDFMQGIAAATAPIAMFVPLALIALSTIASMTTIMAMKSAVPPGFIGPMQPTTLLSKMKGRRGLGAYGAMAAGLGTTLKDGYDLTQEKGMTPGNMAGLAGGVIGGIAGFALGGPMGAAVGASLGNAILGYVGEQFDKKDSIERDNFEHIKEIHGIGAKQQKDTEEIRRIQQDQERRARSLANPQIGILTSINDTLVRNLAVLERTAGQTRRQTELIEDSKFDINSGGAPKLGSINSF